MDSENLLDLLKSLNGEQFYDIFKDHNINEDALKYMNYTHLDTVIPRELFGNRIIFEYNLKKWQVEKGIDYNMAQVPTAGPTSKLFVADNNGVEVMSIENILKKTQNGKTVLKYYENNKSLITRYRKIIASCLVESIIERDVSTSPNYFENLAEEIVKLFPTENKELYYFHIKNRKPGGNLYSKYHNAISKLRKEGVLEYPLKKNCIPDPILNVDIVCADENEISDKEWLKYNIEPIEEVLRKWQNTQRIRNSYLKADNSLKEIFDEWPLYKQSFGNKLVSTDFGYGYPTKEHLLFQKWENFCKPILMLIERQVKDLQSLEILKALNESQFSSDIRNCVILYLLHALIKPTNRRCTFVDGTKKRKYIKSSITDSRNTFLLWAPTSVELTTKIKVLIDKLVVEKETLQPIICAIGSSILDLKDFFVYYANTFYKTENIISSVDIAFKLFHVLNLKYPEDCKSIWLFIQAYFYEIPLKNSEKSALVLAVLNELE